MAHDGPRSHAREAFAVVRHYPLGMNFAMLPVAFLLKEFDLDLFLEFGILNFVVGFCIYFSNLKKKIEYYNLICVGFFVLCWVLVVCYFLETH